VGCDEIKFAVAERQPRPVEGEEARVGVSFAPRPFLEEPAHSSGVTIVSSDFYAPFDSSRPSSRK